MVHRHKEALHHLRVHLDQEFVRIPESGGMEISQAINIKRKLDTQHGVEAHMFSCEPGDIWDGDVVIHVSTPEYWDKIDSEIEEGRGWNKFLTDTKLKVITVCAILASSIMVPVVASLLDSDLEILFAVSSGILGFLFLLIAYYTFKESSWKL